MANLVTHAEVAALAAAVGQDYSDMSNRIDGLDGAEALATANTALTRATAAEAATAEFQPRQGILGLGDTYRWSRKRWTNATPWTTLPHLLPDLITPLVLDSWDGQTPTLALGEYLYSKDADALDPGADYVMTALVETFEASTIRLHLQAYSRGGTPATVNTSKNFDVPGAGTHSIIWYINREDVLGHQFLRRGIRNFAAGVGAQPIRVSELTLRPMKTGTINFAEQVMFGDGSTDYWRTVQRVVDAINLKPGSKILDLGGKEWPTSIPLYFTAPEVVIQNGSFRALDGPDWNDGHTNIPFWDGQPFLKKGLIRRDKKGLSLIHVDLLCADLCNGVEDIQAAALTMEYCKIEGYYNYGVRHSRDGGGGGYLHANQIIKGGNATRNSNADLAVGAGVLIASGEFNMLRNTIWGGQWQVLQVSGSDIALRGLHPWGPESFYDRTVTGSDPVTFQHPNGEDITNTSLGYTHKGITVNNVEYDPTKLTVTLDEYSRVVATPIAPIPAETPVPIRIRRDQVGVEMRGAGSNIYDMYMENKAKVWGPSHSFFDCYPRPGSDVPMDCILQMVPTSNSANIAPMVLNVVHHSNIVQMAKAVRNPNNPSAAWPVHTDAWTHWRANYSHLPHAAVTSGGATVQRFYASDSARAMLSPVALTGVPDWVQFGVNGQRFSVEINAKTVLQASEFALYLPSYRTGDLPVLAAADANGLVLDRTTKQLKLWDGAAWIVIDGTSKAITASDDFNRADGTLTGAWTLLSGTMPVISGNALRTAVDADIEVIRHTTALGDNHRVQVAISAASVGNANSPRGVTLLARVQDANNFYALRIANTGWTLSRFAGSPTVLASGTFDGVYPKTFALDVDGNTLRAYMGAALLATVTDTVFPTGGFAGLRLRQADPASPLFVDDFRAESL